MTCQVAVHRPPETPQGALVLAVVQTGNTAGDGALDPAPAMGLDQVQVVLPLVLPEDMDMDMDPVLGLAPGMDMDGVVVVLVAVVMGLEMARGTMVAEATVEEMVVVIIIGFHQHLRAKTTMGKLL